ncbi:PREDICTED: mevalonate kinase [Theobroma cacao]|uniref:Mevalonate kinase n=1 Tax=Theobroma cacao TaxID=3641 RepID=A0AB32WEX9_THECC|nr:PREDICTED: mevalonate kinase [Theobroma cacao]
MEVTARAPGKIILAGEHAVVHGYTAVASSIDLYTVATLRLRPDGEDTINLQLKDVGLDFSWPIQKIKEVVAHLGSPFSSTPTSCSLEIIKSLTALVDEQSFPEARIGLASGVCAFLWLYTSILGFKPATVIVTSQLPVGAGLGSSAAYCVTLSAALLAFSDSVKVDMSQKGWFIFEEAEVELLNKWAFEGEKIIHGKPSGVDNSVSTFGNMIKFKSGSMTRIDSNMPLRMLITNTKVGRDTKALVANVSSRKSKHPEVMGSVLNAIEFISEEWSNIIQSHALDDLSLAANEERLIELMEMNQGLLLSIGVSHAAIETVLQTTMKYKLASKLTGAGGGGCVLTFLPIQLSEAIVDKVVGELESFGFQCFAAGIGGKGVQISFDSSS